MIAAAVALIAAVAALFLLMRPSLEPGAITGSERAEDARDFLADAREAGPQSYGDAYERAREYQANGQLADAQLLYFYAARGGHPAAEFSLAEMNDPNHHESATSLLEKPDPYQAYKWYSAALEHGSNEAQERLDALRDWATQAAAQGNSEAERLLLQWAQ
jgi:TPR repeat protein